MSHLPSSPTSGLLCGRPAAHSVDTSLVFSCDTLLDNCRRQIIIFNCKQNRKASPGEASKMSPREALQRNPPNPYQISPELYIGKATGVSPPLRLWWGTHGTFSWETHQSVYQWARTPVAQMNEIYINLSLLIIQ